MPLSMYQVSVPLFVRGLEAMSGLLAKGAAHAAEQGLDPAELTAARLAPDMMALTGQVQRASDTSKLSVQRLTGVQSPPMEDNEVTFHDLHRRVAATLAYLQGVDASAFESSEAKDVTLSFGAFRQSFTGESYLLTFALPNFYFHVTTAHAILRQKGVKIGKMDFLGPYGG